MPGRSTSMQTFSRLAERRHEKGQKKATRETLLVLKAVFSFPLPRFETRDARQGAAVGTGSRSGQN